jgi:hypothetical protein
MKTGRRALTAGGLRQRIGIPESRAYWGLAAAIDRGWRYFWARRGMTPPAVPKRQMDCAGSGFAEEFRLLTGGRVR